MSVVYNNTKIYKDIKDGDLIVPVTLLGFKESIVHVISVHMEEFPTKRKFNISIDPIVEIIKDLDRSEDGTIIEKVKVSIKEKGNTESYSNAGVCNSIYYNVDNSTLYVISEGVYEFVNNIRELYIKSRGCDIMDTYKLVSLDDDIVHYVLTKGKLSDEDLKSLESVLLNNPDNYKWAISKDK